MRQCCYFTRYGGNISRQSVSLLLLLLRLNMGLNLWVPRLVGDGKPGSQVRRGLTCPAHFCWAVWHHKAWHLCSSGSTCAICFRQSRKTPGWKLVTRRGVGTRGPHLLLAHTARPGAWGPRSWHRPAVSGLQVRRCVPGDSRCCRSLVLIFKIWTCSMTPKIN